MGMSVPDFALRRSLFVLFLLFVLSLWFAPPASACTCVPPSNVCGAAADYWGTAAVFLGRVESIEQAPSKRVPRFLASRRVRLRVVEPFRGAPAAGSEIVVLTGSGGGDCGYPFKEGQEYLVYGRRSEESGELTTGICSRTRPAAQAAADVEYARAAVAGRAPSGRIVGHVLLETRDMSGARRTRPRPLPGMTVVLTQDGSSIRAQTDAQGRYLVEGPSPGVYRIDAELPDTYYALQSGRTVDIDDSHACAEADLTVLLNGRVAGRVVDPAGRGVAGLTVELADPGGVDEPNATRARALTGSDGTFELTRIPSGRYVAGINTQRDRDGGLPQPRVFFPGVENAADARVVAVANGGRVQLEDFVLPPELQPVRLEGTVFAPDGSPAPGARVFVKNDAETSYILSEPAMADASGRFVLAAFAGVPCRVFAERTGGSARASWIESSDPITITPAREMVPVRIQLRRRY